MTETPPKPLGQILATKVLPQIQPPKASGSPPSKSAENWRGNPKWQSKWLNLNPHHPRIQTMADEAERFSGRWFRCDRHQSLLVLVGESGCGKTHTARALYRFTTAMARTAFDHGCGKTWGGSDIPDSLFLRWPEVVDGFKTGEYWPAYDALEVALLFLDDVGAELDPSKNGANQLCQILSRRERKFTVLTTNIPVAAWPDKFDVRISDRLFRNSVIVDLFGVPSFAEVQS